MKIRWKEQYTKECWEIKTPKSFPQAKIVKENDIPDLMEYNSEPVSGRLTSMREREGTVSILEQAYYWWYGYRTIEDVIRKKYKLGYRYFEIIEPSPSIPVKYEDIYTTTIKKNEAIYYF